MDRLHIFGVGLTIFSTILALWSYIVFSNITLTALGIGLTILGISLVLTPPHPIPPQAIRALLEGATLNIEAILEELNISTRGYYVRASDDKIYVFIPIGKDAGPPSKDLSIKGLIAKNGKSSYIVLIPPSSEIIKVPEVSEARFEDALNFVLVELAELADSIEVSTGENIVIKVRNPRSYVTAWRYRSVLGSLEASIAALLLVRDHRVARIIEELEEDGDRIIVLEIIE